METYTITEDFKLVINKDILEKAGFMAGQEIKILFKENSLEIKAPKEKKSLKGFLKGINTDVHRDHDFKNLDNIHYFEKNK